MRERVRTAQVARLATIDPDGRPHLVPIVFVLDGQRLYSTVDAKPKRSRRLRRVANARERPDVTVLVDHYEDDWGRLWWVSLRGHARVLDTGEEAEWPSDCSSISTSSTGASLPAARCSPSTFSSGAAGTPRRRGNVRLQTNSGLETGGPVGIQIRPQTRGPGEQRLTRQDVLSITSSTQPSPATVCGNPIVVRASRPTWRSSSGRICSASARRACERTAHSACAPIAIPSLTSLALRSSSGPTS